ncbi:helix-turn-helix transcriptional regulator [Acinetobacter bereziniae]|uniref:helix-turn-helix transcriptional regulator n=1 Tax=Acinetobacter bereziniae TaxID=106648 RepID=UPI000575C55A|nr:helix-turn-helix transcriptional regulator [Acinetobacter bereziniae]CEI50723.1 Transcriptional regulatory protein [Acinetobacter bereziniae]
MHNLDQYHEGLVDLIYKIPLNVDGWGVFCEKLAQVLDCSTVHILALDLEFQAYSFSRAINRFVNESDTAYAEVSYLHYPVNDDPRWSGVFNPQRKGWYQCHHDISGDFVENSNLYQNILLPYNMRYTAAHEIILDEKLCMLIAVQTSEQRQPLTQDELGFLDKLLIHLKRVVEIQRSIYEFSNKAIMGYTLIDKLAQPIVILNLSGQVVHQNKAAKCILETNNIIQIEKNYLKLPMPYMQVLKRNLKEIEIAFKKQNDLNQSFFEDGCIKIVDQMGEVFYIFATLLITDQELKAFGIRPSIMLTLYSPTYAPNIDAHLLSAAFNLTPAESKVALSLLDGFLLKEIAQKNHVNIDTVRKQLQSIFKKTDTNRQSELMKLLLNMPKYHEKA